MRFVQGIAAIIVPWSVLLSKHGLYAPGAVSASYCAVGIVFLWPRRRVLLALLQHHQNGNGVVWRTEIWPFQWQIAVSFLCSYFTIQIFTPILFAYRGAVEAGRMGMSMSVAGYIWAVVFAWMSTKAAPFGNLVSRGAYEELDRLFFRTLRQSLTVLLGVVLAAFAGLVAIQVNWPSLAVRMLPMRLFALLMVGAVGTYLVQSFAVYLRAHKSEPFLVQSLAVAGLTSISAVLIIPQWGFAGAAGAYLVCMGLIAPCSAVFIFQRKRRARALECTSC